MMHIDLQTYELIKDLSQQQTVGKLGEWTKRRIANLRDVLINIQSKERPISYWISPSFNARICT